MKCENNCGYNCNVRNSYESYDSCPSDYNSPANYGLQKPWEKLNNLYKPR